MYAQGGPLAVQLHWYEVLFTCFTCRFCPQYCILGSRDQCQSIVNLEQRQNPAYPLYDSLEKMKGAMILYGLTFPTFPYVRKRSKTHA